MKCKAILVGVVHGVGKNGKDWHKGTFLIPFVASSSVRSEGSNAITCFVTDSTLKDFPVGKEVEADVFYFARKGEAAEHYFVKKV